jgi:hypothetical protein
MKGDRDNSPGGKLAILAHGLEKAAHFTRLEDIASLLTYSTASTNSFKIVWNGGHNF